ncbi:hypothetical protein WICPIJ_006984 [Wickerhamomyces pijperi]|uniref:Thioester reductase (TE) domain-containing protein n=1 Tax=Wickerhamomyces pijperi TaxID=599730 RepID=A0A9P8Q0Q5_WICPI|nr:hypothetical protein WICPIJ_006984 [Wickerhamomyces pijperi]
MESPSVQLCLFSDTVRNSCDEFTRQCQFFTHDSSEIFRVVLRVGDIPFELVHQLVIGDRDVQLDQNSHVFSVWEVVDVRVILCDLLLDRSQNSISKQRIGESVILHDHGNNVLQSDGLLVEVPDKGVTKVCLFEIEVVPCAEDVEELRHVEVFVDAVVAVLSDQLLAPLFVHVVAAELALQLVVGLEAVAVVAIVVVEAAFVVAIVAVELEECCGFWGCTYWLSIITKQDSISNSKTNITSEMSKLVVFGGNGFLAIESGFQVTSLSRSGKPPKNLSFQDMNWVSKVQWKSANIFKPETYKQELKDAKSCVHSIGILLEHSNYKNTINSNKSILNEFSNLVKTPNPLDKSLFNSYESVNRDSAILLAETFKESTTQENPAFVYISADKGFPGLPKGYINSKRQAEDELSYLKHLRTIIMRPGFMYDQETKSVTGRDTLKNVVNVLNWGKDKFAGDKFGILNDPIRPTVSTQRVADAVIYRLQDETFQGIVGLDELVEK